MEGPSPPGRDVRSEEETPGQPLSSSNKRLLNLLNILAPVLVSSFSFGGLINISSIPQSPARAKKVEDSPSTGLGRRSDFWEGDSQPSLPPGGQGECEDEGCYSLALLAAWPRASSLNPPVLFLIVHLGKEGWGQIPKLEYYFAYIPSFFLIPCSMPQRPLKSSSSLLDFSPTPLFGLNPPF